jgi:hypothetical protein
MSLRSDEQLVAAENMHAAKQQVQALLLRSGLCPDVWRPDLRGARSTDFLSLSEVLSLAASSAHH